MNPVAVFNYTAYVEHLSGLAYTHSQGQLKIIVKPANDEAQIFQDT